jgi:amino acid transporter
MHELSRGWIHILMLAAAIAAIIYAVVHFGYVKRILVGRPMRTRELRSHRTKLVWWMALPILSADLYSSVAYGPESGMTELAHLGKSAKWLILPITSATVVLLAILITSYIMAIIAYPNGGGAYSIAKDNFRTPWMSLIAASALMMDYVLTVAVSVSAGIHAIASSYPVIAPYETPLAVLCVLLMLIVNLRGVSESATVFAWPTFFFMAAMIFLIGTGFVHESQYGFVQPRTPPFGLWPTGITIILLLKAFSSACSALTGIETISNAVPIFRERQRGAIKAYVSLGVITAITLLGFSFHLYVQGISVNPANSMLSQLAETYFGHGVLYQVIMWSTFVVLFLAANSIFTGFPQLAALVSMDGFLPRSLTMRGDRLGYSNGMIVLASSSAILIEVFRAQTNALIPLYAIGVFVAFTIGQAGLARRWFRRKGHAWRTKAGINIIGAVVAGVVAAIFAITKFTEGAWIVLIIIPMLVLGARSIRRHYDLIAEELRIDLSIARPRPHRVISIVLISGIHRVVLNTLSFAKSIDSELIAVYVGFDDESIEKMEKKWEEWGSPCRLVTLKSEYRSLIQPLSRLIKMLETWEGGKPEHIHILLPQFIPKRWWHYALHNQTSLMLRAWFLLNKDVVITTVPYHLHR